MLNLAYQVLDTGNAVFRNAIPSLLADSDESTFSSTTLPAGIIFLSVVITDDGGSSIAYSPESLRIEVKHDRLLARES